MCFKMSLIAPLIVVLWSMRVVVHLEIHIFPLAVLLISSFSDSSVTRESHTLAINSFCVYLLLSHVLHYSTRTDCIDHSFFRLQDTYTHTLHTHTTHTHTLHTHTLILVSPTTCILREGGFTLCYIIHKHIYTCDNSSQRNVHVYPIFALTMYHRHTLHMV